MTPAAKSPAPAIQCPECSPTPWTTRCDASTKFWHDIFDAAGEAIATSEDAEIAAFIVAAANAAHEKDKPE